MSNYSSCHGNTVEELEAAEREEPSTFNWRSSIRKKFSRLSKKKRPTSLNFDALPSPPPVIPDALDLGISSQSLLFPAYENNIKSSSSLTSETDNYYISFQPKNSNFKEQSKFYSQGNVNFVHESVGLNGVDRNSLKTPENQSSDIKSRFKKLVKKGHLSASISSLSTKLKESFQTPYDNLLASNLSFDNEKEKIYQHFRRKRHSSGSKSKDALKTSNRYSIGCYPNDLADKFENNMFTDLFHPPTSSHQRTKSPLDEVIHSMRHIDSSSEDDYPDGIDTKNKVCSPSSGSSSRSPEGRQRCYSDWVEKRGKTTPVDTKVSPKLEGEDASTFCQSEFSKIKREIKENRGRLQSCLNRNFNNCYANPENFSCSSSKDFVPFNHSISGCHERENLSLQYKHFNDDVNLNNKSFPTTNKHDSSSPRLLNNHDVYSSCNSDATYSKCYQFSGAARDEANNMRANVGSQDKEMRPVRYPKLGLAIKLSTLNEKASSPKTPSKDFVRLKARDSKPSMIPSHLEKADSLFEILERLKDQLQKEKLRRNLGNLSNDRVKFLENSPMSCIKGTNAVEPKNSCNSGIHLVKPFVLNQVDKEEDCLPGIKSTLIKVHEFDSCIEVIPEFDNLNLVNDKIKVNKKISISADAKLIANIATDDNAFNTLHNYDVEQTRNHSEIDKNKTSSENYSTNSSSIKEPINITKLVKNAEKELSSPEHDQESKNNLSNGCRDKSLLGFNDSCRRFNSDSNVSSAANRPEEEKSQELKRFLSENLRNQKITSSESHLCDPKQLHVKKLDSTEIDTFRIFGAVDHRPPLMRTFSALVKHLSLENIHNLNHQISDVQKHKRSFSELSLFYCKKSLQHLLKDSHFGKPKFVKTALIETVSPKILSFSSKKTNCQPDFILPEKTEKCGVTQGIVNKPTLSTSRRKKNKRKRRRKKNNKNAGVSINQNNTCVELCDRAEEDLQREALYGSHQLICTDAICSVPESFPSLGPRPMNEVPIYENVETLQRALGRINYVPEDELRCAGHPSYMPSHRGHGPEVPLLHTDEHSGTPSNMPVHSFSLRNKNKFRSSFHGNNGSIRDVYNEISSPDNALNYQHANDRRVPPVNYHDPLVPASSPCSDSSLINYAREEVSFVKWERTSDHCSVINEERIEAENEIIEGNERTLNNDSDTISNLSESQLSDSHSKMLMNFACENKRFYNSIIDRDRCLDIDVSADDDVCVAENQFGGDVKLRSKMRSFKHRASNDKEMATDISGVSKLKCDTRNVNSKNFDRPKCVRDDNIAQNNFTCSNISCKFPAPSPVEEQVDHVVSDQLISEFITFVTDVFIFNNNKCSYYGGIEKNPFWKVLVSYHNITRRKLLVPVLRLHSYLDDDLKSVRWVLSHGEDLLEFHQVPQNTLLGITRQVDSFNHFYSTAKREADKGASLLLQEEESILPSEAFEEAQDLAKNLRRHLSSFANRLHLTKDRLEDTAKCYLLLDKAYEWALEAMKAVGRVKTSGTATPDQVGAAVEAIGGLLQENPPVSEDTFTAMLDMASKLNNQTLLQQCKMAHARCEETMSLLRSRQASLLKARRQMEFDCQSFVDLNDVIEEPPPLTWLAGTPLNNSGRRRSGCSIGSRPRDPLSRCSSFDTDDDSVFSETPFGSSTPSKLPVEAKSSLGGIKELSESNEDVRGNRNFVRSPRSYMRSSAIDFRLAVSTVDPPIILGRTSPPMTLLNAPTSAVRAFSSGSSSCSSSDSSGPVTGNNLFKDHSRSSWRFSDTSHRSAEEANDSLDESIHPLSPLSNRCSLPSAANSHLLIRGSQINLSNSEDLSNEEVRRNKTLLLIMQELVQTERDYVNSLEYIIENYGPELLRDDIPQALRGQRNVIFGNIEKIFEFHSGYFLRSLENCQSRPFAVGSIFLKYESQFYLYALYNKNKPKSDDLMSELGSNFFKGKQMELGDKMDLSSYLLKPVQRMGKYALLLKQLLKECDRNEEGFEDLKAAEEMVQFQLRHGNDLLAMDSLRDCDVNLKEQGRLLRQGEFLVSEGNKGKKSLRHVFLFEDLILFSKTKRDPEKKTLDVFQYKQSLKSSDIGLTEQVGDNPLKFEIWFRKRKPSDTFVLQSSSLSMKEAWTEEISKLLWRQALKNRKLRLCEMSSMGIGNKPCLDIRPSEDQINDRSVCMGKAPPRLRLSSSSGLSDNTSGVRRPHSVISVSSSGSSTGSSHSSSAGPSFVGTLNLGFESGDSPKPLQRSVTRTSQCSAESGILADLFPERDVEDNHTKVERSNSTATNTSVDSVLSPSSPISPTSYPSSPSTMSLSEGGSMHPLSRQLLPAEGSINKIVLTTEV